ncbi:phosphohydrolase [Secundilactobacillus kimchicus]|uniref:HD superfamily hydrolase n=2 Tax=Secundilactobacillus kimchicus TaxID=528209 RepID=A0A0R1HKZ1_9LACO|nr:HD domain-containing protein [Secundilactobacillus kimchicus]KRK46936.1 HD superfamily hydrolase [Secundilactobacillus kimchicus JCM 15530]MBT9672674.1 phosphohydrolase [Secundilactobacillus kimchicus]
METTEQLALIQDYTVQQLSGDKSGHGLDHIHRVVTNVKMLLADEPSASYLITLTAAYLHDVIDDKLVSDVEAARQGVIELLTQAAFSQPQINTVMLIIDNMSFSKSLTTDRQPLPIEGLIVQDADRLDAIGAIGIARAIYYGGKHGEKIYDPTVKPRTSMTKAEYRNLANETIINHFYEKLFKLADQMNTPAAKRIAQARQKVMSQFVNDFKSEWNGMA